MRIGTRRTSILYAPSTAAAVTSWWLEGGISAANCIAAYQPKGAASLAASYVNLANPGTYDLTVGTSAPAWNAATGWTFTANQDLLTGITPATGWSMIYRIANHAASSANGLAGEYTAGARFALYAAYPIPPVSVIYCSGGIIYPAPGHLAGTLGIAGQQGYRDGAADGGAIAAWTTTATNAITVGKDNGLVGTAPYDGLALAIYNTTLSAPQMLALHTAMAAL